MVMPIIPGGGPDHEAIVGDSYGALLVAGVESEELLDVLEAVGFSGWIAPPEGDWVVAIGDPGAGVVASSGRGIVEIGAVVAERPESRVIAVRVRRDRDLAIVAWQGGEEVARYWSDPSQEPDADREVLSEPLGVEGADALAALAGCDDAAEKLVEILEEELDTDSVIESERLRHVLDLLGLPTWIVAAPTLPKDLPTGPPTSAMTRLRGGRPGVAGVLLSGPSTKVRKSRTPPPVVEDPPRGATPGDEYWML